MSRIDRQHGAQQPVASGKRHDVVIVGAGFAGMYMLHRIGSLLYLANS